jgi:hypothetical protein
MRNHSATTLCIICFIFQTHRYIRTVVAFFISTPKKSLKTPILGATQHAEQELLTLGATQHAEQELLTLGATQHPKQELLTLGVTQHVEKKLLTLGATQHAEQELLTLGVTQQLCSAKSKQFLLRKWHRCVTLVSTQCILITQSKSTIILLLHFA